MARRVFEVIGQPDMIQDERFATNTGASAQPRAIDSIVGEWFAQKSRDEALALMRADEVTSGLSTHRTRPGRSRTSGRLRALKSGPPDVADGVDRPDRHFGSEQRQPLRRGSFARTNSPTMESNERAVCGHSPGVGGEALILDHIGLADHFDHAPRHRLRRARKGRRNLPSAQR